MLLPPRYDTHSLYPTSPEARQNVWRHPDASSAKPFWCSLVWDDGLFEWGLGWVRGAWVGAWVAPWMGGSLIIPDHKNMELF